MVYKIFIRKFSKKDSPIMLTKLKVLFCFAVACSALDSSPAADLDQKEVKVVDGDTIHINNEKHRLIGYDALEICQVCTDNNGEEWYGGQVAKGRLTEIIGDQSVRCETKEKDKYGRWLSTCFVGARGGEVNLNEAMVKEGLAYIDPRYDQTYIRSLEQAKEREIGIWAHNCQEPWEYRKQGASYNCLDMKH